VAQQVGDPANASAGGSVRPEIISPTQEDPVVADNCEVIGGPMGVHSAGGRWWNALRVLLVLTVLGFLVGWMTKTPCTTTGWADPGRYTHLCYTDIAPLFELRGFADHVFPYIQDPLPGQQQLEYPVLTGLFMALAGFLTPSGDSGMLWFYVINSLMLAVCLGVAVIATALTVKRRPWDAAMVALAPGTILCATINWDLIAVALTAVALCLWAKRYPTWAGVVLGLAAAAKFYPLMLLGPLLILCWRAARMNAFFRCLGGFVVAWLVCNVPFMLINFDGWATFYTFSSERGEDFGSFWFVLSSLGQIDGLDISFSVPADWLNLVATGLFLLLCVGVAILGLAAKRRPRLAAMCFLVIAAFLITNKVYSPQYVLWLIPLAALARPRWRDFLIWQVGETIYYVAIWLYLAGFNDGKGLPAGWYAVAIMIHIAATVFFAVMVVRDALKPSRDPIRTDGFDEDRDDPGGGVLDGAPDRWARDPLPV